MPPRCWPHSRALGPRGSIALVLASSWLVPLLRAKGFGAVCVGSDAVFDLETWSPHGRRARAARNALNRARRVGAPGDHPWRRVVLRIFPRLAAPFYNLAGIRRFERKFLPTRWEPV